MSAMEEDWELDDINTATDYREEREKTPTSFGHVPENVNERSAHAEGFTKESNIYAANIQVIQEKDSDEKKKPWRRAGVDITDYFNYGFDEKSWNAYYKKQSKMCALRRKLHANIRAQRGYTRYGEEESESSREAYDTIGSGCREESYVRYLSNGGTNLQADTKNLHWEDSITAFLTAGYNKNSLGAFIPPQSFQISPATLDSRCSNDFNGPSTSQHHFSSGSMAISAGAMNAAKAWEHIIWQERCTQDRSQSREHGQAQHSKRSQHKENHYFSRSREEEQKKHRDTTVQEHKHASFEKVSEEKMQIDDDEGQQEASQRSSSNKSTRDDDRKDRGEDQKKHRDTTVQEHKHVRFEKVSGEERQRETSNGQHETSQSNRSSSNRSSRDGGHKDRKSRRKRKKRTKRTRKTRRARGCPLTEKGN